MTHTIPSYRCALAPIRKPVLALALGLTFVASASAQTPPSPWTNAIRAARPDVPAPASADENAWTHVERAVRLYHSAQATLRVPGPDGAPAAPLLNATLFILPARDESSAQVQAFIDRSAAAFEGAELPKALAAAVAAPVCEQSASDGWIIALVRSGERAGPDAPLAELAQLEVIRFVRAARAGDEAMAVIQLRSAARLARLIEQGPLARRLLGSMVADQIALALREEVMARRISPALASAYLKALDEGRPAAGDHGADWALTANLERVQLEGLAWAIARQTGPDAEAVFARAMEACDLHERADAPEIVSRATKAENIDPTVALLSRALSAYSPMPRAQRRAASAFIAPRSVGDLLPCDPFCVARFLTENWTWVDAWLDQIDAHESRFQSARLMLALEAARAATETDTAYPASLDALVPGVLSVLPMDPVSGRGFGYRLMPDPAADPYRRPYLLWTIGSDGDDDRGREPGSPADLPRVLVPGQAEPADGDWVFNSPGRP